MQIENIGVADYQSKGWLSARDDNEALPVCRNAVEDDGNLITSRQLFGARIKMCYVSAVQ